VAKVTRAAKKKKTPGNRRSAPPSGGIKVVDVYCGIGGLTHGLVLEGFNVVAGVDNDRSCRYAFEKNNKSEFIARDISRFTAKELRELYRGAAIRVLVGCAPCQPYSPLGRRKLTKKEKRARWYPMYHFMTLVKRVKPEIVSMENVPDLSNTSKYPVFGEFVEALRLAGYDVSFKTVDASKYGVPQRRQRLVLLASRLGPIELIPETHAGDAVVNVRAAIGSLPKLKTGAIHPSDPLHRASALSDLNKRRIAATPKDGGSATSWADDLVPRCYRKKTGKSYMVTVYGRMRWKDPAPTMTTHCTTLGTGRFGHPSQNRAISLREAAIFQSFPDYYEFAENNDVGITRTARHIGNAVPVLLGRAIARSMKRHIAEHE
jgi:DNA (cytosine-5)-methyltransferase 1